MEFGSIFSALDLQDNEVVLNTIDGILMIGE